MYGLRTARILACKSNNMVAEGQKANSAFGTLRRKNKKLYSLKKRSFSVWTTHSQNARAKAHACWLKAKK